MSEVRSPVGGFKVSNGSIVIETGGVTEQSFGARARVLSTVVARDDWPPQRAVAGFDLAPATPIPNLWNVGDGVKEYANGGTTACAETARLVVDQIGLTFPPGGPA